ncbi:MAG: shikimate kinase [Bacteroidota bacterium]
MRIFLIGFMGSGKTTIGKKLADFMQYSFIDLDEQIVQHENCEISQIFSQKGEDYFRTLEHKMLHEVLREDHVVVAAGGGTPCFFDNMKLMTEGSITVYLKADENTLKKRLKCDPGSRPLLPDLEVDPERFNNFFVQREPYYERAQLILDDYDELEISELAGRIISHHV